MTLTLLTTPDGLTPAQEQYVESLKDTARTLDRRLDAVLDLCDEILDREDDIYREDIKDIRAAARGEDA